MTKEADSPPSAPNLTLLIGGARSGKSALAERLALATHQPVIFVATMEPRDDEVRQRIEQHRASRPPAWRTIEEPIDVVAALAASAHPGAAIIVDCVTLWVSNMLLRDLPDIETASIDEADTAVKACVDEVTGLLDWSASYDGEIFVVTNEVGAGVVPPYRLGRIFRDALGRANSVIAARAGRVYHLNAGLALELKALGARPIDAFGEAPGE